LQKPEKLIQNNVFYRLKESASDTDSLNREVIRFKDIARKSLALAASFLEAGLKPGDTLAIAAYNCPEWLYVEYACLRIKVVMIRVPINIIDQNALIPTLRKFSCRLLVVDEAVAVKLQSFINNFSHGLLTDLKDLKNIVILNKLPISSDIPPSIQTVSTMMKHTTEAANVLQIQNTIDPEEIAVVFPTSGTTGEPKFAACTHFMLINWSHIGYTFRPKYDGEVQFSDRPFIWLSGNVFGPLLRRTAMVCLDTTLGIGKENIETVYKVIDEEKVTNAAFPPYLIHNIKNGVENNLPIPASLKYVSTFGECLPNNLLEFTLRTFPYLGIYYGMTETGSACARVVSLDSHHDSSSVQMMKCLPGCELKITGDNGRVIPRGEEGHILLRSVCAMVEYYMNPEAK